MRVLIIGYGSIGKKHAEILSQINRVKEIFILTKQTFPKKFYKCKTYKDIIKIDPDYIIVSSVTTNHYKDLKFINENLKNKVIVVEKPLFEKNYIFKNKRNFIYVGYNLRFHPVLKKIKSIVSNRKIYSINAECFSNLINWRKDRDYKKTSSAKKSSGGGVILDLSHEFDYISWIFEKELIPTFKIFDKLSDLKIETEDFLILNAKINKDIIVNILLKYYSFINSRKILIFGKNLSIKGDLLKNQLTVVYKNKIKRYNYKNFNIKDTYFKMHNAILNKVFKDVCTFKEGIKVMKLIDNIKKNK